MRDILDNTRNQKPLVTNQEIAILYQVWKNETLAPKVKNSEMLRSTRVDVDHLDHTHPSPSSTICTNLGIIWLIFCATQDEACVWCVGVQQFTHTPVFSHAQGLVCGHLPSRPHARLLSHTQVANCHVFCSVNGKLPQCACKQMTTLFFTQTCQLSCVLQGTRQLPQCAYKQMATLSFTRTCQLPCVFAGYTATALVCL